MGPTPNRATGGDTGGLPALSRVAEHPHFRKSPYLCTQEVESELVSAVLEAFALLPEDQVLLAWVPFCGKRSVIRIRDN